MLIIADSRNRDAWLDARTQYVCGSECAAMLGVSEYQTRSQLVDAKAGLIEPWEGNESTRIGQLMEDHLFAPMARALLGWHMEPFGLLVRDPVCEWLAATPDFLVSTPWGPAVVQTKDTTAMAQEDCRPRKDGSPSVATYVNGAPIWHQIQIQAELACTGLEWGALLVLHSAGGGKKLRAYPARRHGGVIARLRDESTRLMADVAKLKGGWI